MIDGEVAPSQRANDKPHEPWVCLNKEKGYVVAAHCTCKAGLWYCLTWSQFKRENEWTPRTVTRIQDIVSHRITQSHDTFQTVVLFDVVAV
ncbi:hypothetical protein DPMN_153059 [Dreissena polymorpha]|uniref:Uncharacterized protein n=1 Tax=Dreissena polymorpha TaxID=45954 RepID=A0A9D4FMG5_DREPO|nr:hypothetical protein DPMN_153059 [Dreissena polymorpha]